MRGNKKQALCLAFINITKAFDLVIRHGLFKMLPLIGRSPKLLSMVRYFHDGTLSSVQFDGNISEELMVNNGVKEGCVLAPTFFSCILFELLSKPVFKSSTDEIYLHSRSNGHLFNVARFKAKTRKVAISDMLFADGAVIASHSEEGIQRLIDSFSTTCDLFNLTISLKKVQMMGQGTSVLPSIHIEGEGLETVH